MRKCSVCKIEKELEEFHKKGNGHSYMCKDCRKDYIRKHYQENKEGYKKKADKSRKKTRDWFKEYKGTLSCEECGENHIACLDFHHIDRNTKDSEIAKLIVKNNKSKILQEISKCKVLCSNCHRKLHWEEKQIDR